MTDDEIIDLYLVRDERAITETSGKYGVRLKQLSRNIVSDVGTAEECVNDTWLKTWESIPPHEPRDYFFAYIAKITRSLSLSFCRRASAQKRSANVTSLSTELEDCIGGVDTTERVTDELHFKDSLNRFLKELPYEKRDMFVRRYWYMDSISQIAGRHGCSDSRVTTELYRVRKKLKAHLEADGIYV